MRRLLITFVVFTWAAPALADPSVAEFQCDDIAFALDTSHIVDAKPLYGENGAGLRIEFSSSAHTQLEAFVATCYGDLHFLILEELVFSAPTPQQMPVQISFPVQGLGNATWLARTLRGGNQSVE